MFIEINALKYRGNLGDVEKIKMRLNVNSIAYIDVDDESKLLIKIIGEVSQIYVVDPESIHKVLVATR